MCHLVGPISRMSPASRASSTYISADDTLAFAPVGTGSGHLIRRVPHSPHLARSALQVNVDDGTLF